MVDKTAVWERIRRYAGSEFRTATDLPFTNACQATSCASHARGVRSTAPIQGSAHVDQVLVDPARLLESRRAIVRATAVDVLLPVLDDPANRVTALAVPYLRDRAGEIPTATVAQLATSARTRDRLTALRLRQRLGAWERVRRDLMAIADPDPEVRDLGRSDLLAWLQNGAASTYGRPSPDQRDDIAAGPAHVTDQNLLSEHRVRQIAFASGLLMSAAGPTPPEASLAPLTRPHP